MQSRSSAVQLLTLHRTYLQCSKCRQKVHVQPLLRELMGLNLMGERSKTRDIGGAVRHAGGHLVGRLKDALAVQHARQHTKMALA